MQLKRAQGLLEEFEAAGQRVGIGQQLLQRVVGDADAPLALQAIHLQRHERARFGDAIDGDIDPGRLLVDAGRMQVQRRTQLMAVVRRQAFDVGARLRSLRRPPKILPSQLNTGRSFDPFWRRLTCGRRQRATKCIRVGILRQNLLRCSTLLFPPCGGWGTGELSSRG